VKVKHNFLENDVVCLKSYTIPVPGTKGVFTPKVVPNFYKVVKITDFSVDITVKCLKTGNLIQTIAKDLKLIDPSFLLPTLGEINLWEPSLLEEWKSISRPGIIEECFTLLPQSDTCNHAPIEASSLDNVQIPPPQPFDDQDTVDLLYEPLDLPPSIMPVPDEFIDDPSVSNIPTGQVDIENLIQTNPNTDHNFKWKSCLKTHPNIDITPKKRVQFNL